MTKEDILHHFQDINFYYNDCMMYDDLSRMLDELIAENKGEWIEGEYWEDNDGGFGTWKKCSICGKSKHHKSKFCPNCGADMRGDKNEKS